MVSGTCLQGVIHQNDSLLLGPTSLGEFIPVAIRGIQRKRLPVQGVRGGQTASFALKKVKKLKLERERREREREREREERENGYYLDIFLSDQEESDQEGDGDGGSGARSRGLLGV